MNKMLSVFGAALIIGGGVFLSSTDSGQNLAASLFNTQTTMTTATLSTTKGDITIELFMDKVPTIAGNFEKLASAGMYENVDFHRVIEGFMIQGGDFENGNGTGGHAFGGGELNDEIVAELSHTRGMVSMANRGPNTNGSQFFIMHADAPQLDGGYSIFGRVTDGMDVVDAIATTETGYMDKPVEAVTITSVDVKKPE